MTIFKVSIFAGLTLTLAVPALAGDTRKAEPTKLSREVLDAEHERQNEAFLKEVRKRPSPPSSTRTQPYIPRSHEVKLVDRDTKVRAELVAIVDGRAIYLPEGAVDRTRYRRVKDVPPKAFRAAILQNGVAALARAKVGQTVTLFLRNDAKGYAYVTQLTR